MAPRTAATRRTYTRRTAATRAFPKKRSSYRTRAAPTSRTNRLQRQVTALARTMKVRKPETLYKNSQFDIDGISTTTNLPHSPTSFSFPSNPGRKFMMKWVKIEGELFYTPNVAITPPVNSGHIRLMLVIDKTPGPGNTGIPNYAMIADSNTIPADNAMMRSFPGFRLPANDIRAVINSETAGRFKIVYDKIITINTLMSTSKLFKVFVRLNTEVTASPSNEVASLDVSYVTKNALHCFIVADHPIAGSGDTAHFLGTANVNLAYYNL